MKNVTIVLFSCLVVFAAMFAASALADIYCSQGLICEGADGNNTMHGTQYADQMYGYGGDDSMYGYDSGDSIFGGDGRDDLHGGYGTDHLHGGAGNDVLYVSSYSCKPDELDGGNGTDTAYYRPGIGNSFNSVEIRIPYDDGLCLD